MRANREALVAVAKRHAQAEAGGDIATTLATLEDAPVYELATLGISFRGKDAARTYYEHFFGTFQPWIASFELVNQWETEEGLGEEYWLDVAPPGAARERHRIIGILVFGETKLAGERLYASERLLRVMLGPAYEIAEVQSGRRPQPELSVHDVVATLESAPELVIRESTTHDEVRDTRRSFGALGEGARMSAVHVGVADEVRDVEALVPRFGDRFLDPSQFGRLRQTLPVVASHMTISPLPSPVAAIRPSRLSTPRSSSVA